MNLVAEADMEGEEGGAEEEEEEGEAEDSTLVVIIRGALNGIGKELIACYLRVNTSTRHYEWMCVGYSFWRRICHLPCLCVTLYLESWEWNCLCVVVVVFFLLLLFFFWFFCCCFLFCFLFCLLLFFCLFFCLFFN